ncbi:MAG TPA: hypothetical protein VFG68_06455 [Fimbriiglobus sp.]|nr:hypothetical protein [Fimbriiglobus sp.]
MAKSSTEQIREVAMELATITERLNNFRDSLSERRLANEKLAEKMAELAIQTTDLRQEIALLRQRLDDHLKRVEEWDRRRWMLYGLLIGAILSFVANLIVALVRK